MELLKNPSVYRLFTVVQLYNGSESILALWVFLKGLQLFSIVNKSISQFPISMCFWEYEIVYHSYHQVRRKTIEKIKFEFV